MSSRFTAVPLGSGESFILETDVEGKRKVVLVDGGQSKRDDPAKNELLLAIERHCPGIGERIDIAICTHRDHDHAGGFPAFVKAWLSRGKQIGEFWLPGAWSGAVEHVLVNPDQIISLLTEGAAEAAAKASRSEVRPTGDVPFAATERSTMRSIDALVNEMRSSRRTDDRSVPQAQTFASLQHSVSDAMPESEEHPQRRMARAATSWGFTPQRWTELAGNLDSSSLHVASLSERLNGHNVIWWASPPLVSFPLARTLAANAIDTAEAIRAIASAAVSFDIPVRWFDFELFEDGQSPAGGYPGFLIPLNAVEVQAAPRQDEALVLFLKLALTEQNVASLVFQRVETNEEPGVVFVADSRLAFGIDRPEKDFPKHIRPASRPVIYTAPHHGSRNNDHAYGMLAAWLGELYPSSIAVRNGGVWNQRLEGYLGIALRRCAQCYQCHGGAWSQLVQINSGGGHWLWPSKRGRDCGEPRPNVRPVRAPSIRRRGMKKNASRLL